MTDSISRCELFNKLATIPAPPEANEFKAEVYKVIQQMETVGRWIPCSERLPEVHEEPYYADHEEILHESDHVLTCCKAGNGFVYAIGTVIHDEVCDSYEWSDLYDYADCVIDDMQVLAWMPLPEPWKGTDDE